MNKQDAEKYAMEYLKPVFGFVLKRCSNVDDAQDLSQEIILKAYRTFLIRDDIDDVGKFIWTIAHNTLSNHYRRQQVQFSSSITLEEISDIWRDSSVDIEGDLISKETENQLQREIAYLSKMQRRIVIAYYYENKKQDEIAKELNIPTGTVKWHLFEAKKELKRGMETMRKSSELKFNPIRFEYCGIGGSLGSKGNCGAFFRSVLSQNIAYVIWKEAKTINQIADALGVSPVYIENEVEYLEKYCFLLKKGDKYLCNILLDEPNEKINRLHDEMYEKAARIFANELFDELMHSDIWEDEKLYGGCTDDVFDSQITVKDRNFFLWSLIPYIISRSGEKYMDHSVSMEQAATHRPDGGFNICHASIMNPDVEPAKYWDSMHQWFGPCWHVSDNMMLWQIDSEWSDTRIQDMVFQIEVPRTLAMLNRYLNGECLSVDEYTYLIEKGYLNNIGQPGEKGKTVVQAVVIDGNETNKKLLSIGNRVREKYLNELEALKKPFVDEILKETPRQLQIMQRYVLQFMFCADGWFLLHCMKELVNNGKLKLPTEAQKRALMTVLVHE